MNPRIDKQFPGGSKTRVNDAGARVRNGDADSGDLETIDTWRAAHRSVLNTFQSILRTRTKGTDVTVAQRHKRRRTIFGKLDRFPQMKLSRMDDVAGCRLIFPTQQELYAFRRELHAARFSHKLRNEVDRYDYIKSPKSTGYRGVHDVYEYDVNSNVGRHLKGLLVEIQYRTLVQHAWATAVEVIGFITENQPKFQQGDTRYLEAMALASELLARAEEQCKGPFPDLADDEVVKRFVALDKELELLKLLRGLNAADSMATINRNAILIFSQQGDLEVRTYRGATDALNALFELERTTPGSDIVLVRADTSDEVRLAFKNYFSDARDFIEMVDRACEKLSGRRVIAAPGKKRRVNKRGNRQLSPRAASTRLRKKTRGKKTGGKKTGGKKTRGKRVTR